LNCHQQRDLRKRRAPIEPRPQHVALKPLLSASCHCVCGMDLHTACTRTRTADWTREARKGSVQTSRADEPRGDDNLGRYFQKLRTRMSAESVVEYAARLRTMAVEALESGEWHPAYLAAKSWISAGGGALLLDPWLIYVASGILHGQPRIAVHSVDLALKAWVQDPPNRAILRWIRGRLIVDWLRDPKTAIDDFTYAEENSPEWLREEAVMTRSACIEAATKSRKRKPSVEPAPEFTGPSSDREFVERPVGLLPTPGAQPSLWELVLRIIGR